MQPSPHILVIFRDLDGGLELFGSDALEAEERVVERTIIMILAECSRQAGAAFINGASGDHESGKAFARAVRGLFVKISGKNGNYHKVRFAISYGRIYLDTQSMLKPTLANTLFLCTR